MAHILIVDDSHTEAHVLKEMLEKGYFWGRVRVVCKPL
jgi:CheY-like chemotaxis protein